MSETEFMILAEATLNRIEVALDDCSDVVDLECSRNGNVLEIELIDNGSKVIVNIQAAMQQLWLAARSGGFHYQYDGQLWRDTRDGADLMATLSRVLSEQGGASIHLV